MVPDWLIIHLIDAQKKKGLRTAYLDNAINNNIDNMLIYYITREM